MPLGKWNCILLAGTLGNITLQIFFRIVYYSVNMLLKCRLANKLNSQFTLPFFPLTKDKVAFEQNKSLSETRWIYVLISLIKTDKLKITSLLFNATSPKLVILILVDVFFSDAAYLMKKWGYARPKLWLCYFAIKHRPYIVIEKDQSCKLNEMSFRNPWKNVF